VLADAVVVGRIMKAAAAPVGLRGDARGRDGGGRYVNHSCRPNADAHRIGHKVVIRAIKNIKTGAPRLPTITAVII
jgi:hypothetical protein